MSSPQILTVPKQFFVEERNKFYANWVEAFPREFFQNSVDAGAKTIRITVDTAVGKGSFGRDPHVAEVTRFVFEDDGHGMSHSVLENVFFTLGASTKRDENASVGGFGRARIMQAFSQDRYSIRTRDRFVEGDGPERINLTVPEAEAALKSWSLDLWSRARQARDQSDYAKSDRLERAADRIDRDLMHLSRESLNGCRFEVDLDPNAPGSHRNRPSVERIKEAVLSYMSKSDIAAEVFLNGERVNQPKRKLEGRRKLYATFAAHELPEEIKANPKVEIVDRPDGLKDVAFATISTVKPTEIRDGEKGRLNVRVRGASMFTTYSNSDDHAIVVELLPTLAREALTSNRDSLRSEFQDAVSQFGKQLATDARAALADSEEQKLIVLQGGLGEKQRARKAKLDMAGASDLDASADVETRNRVSDLRVRSKERNTTRYYGDWAEFTKKGLQGVPAKDILLFLETLKKGGVEATFLLDYADRKAVDNMAFALERQGENAALESASGELLGHLVARLRLERAIAEANEAVGYADKMAGLHDITILKSDMSPPEDHYDKKEREERRRRLSKAAGRYDPRNWDIQSGKGTAPRKLLAAWDVAIDHSIDALLDAFPNIEPFPYTTGWAFSHQQKQYDPIARETVWSNANALYFRPSEDAVRAYLLNPIDNDDFKAKFNPRDPDDRAKIIAVAAHEVAHTVAESGHNEAFAKAYTRIMERILAPRVQKEILKDMTARMAAVDALYASGKTKIQPMDDEEGVRPSMRLMGALSSSVAASPRNDGTILVDCSPSRADLTDDYEEAPEFSPGM